MLGRQHDRVDGLRNHTVVADGHLGLTVGSQEIDQPGLAHLGQLFRHAMRQPDRQRHELRRLGGGIPEHDALVSGALRVVCVGAVALARLLCAVHALRDIGRLRSDRDLDTA